MYCRDIEQAALRAFHEDDSDSQLSDNEIEMGHLRHADVMLEGGGNAATELASRNASNSGSSGNNMKTT